MNTDYIDIVLLHCMTEANWPEKMKGAMDALSEAKAKGHVRAVGCSCHTFDALQAAAASPWVDVDLARINPFAAIMDVEEKRGGARRCCRCSRDARAGQGGLRHEDSRCRLVQGRQDRASRCDSFCKQQFVSCFVIGFSKTEHIDDIVRRIERVQGIRAVAGSRSEERSLPPGSSSSSGSAPSNSCHFAAAGCGGWGWFRLHKAAWQARRMADFMLSGLAAFCPAMSNAVPWSTLVRMIGRPSVVWQALSKASSLTGMSPWSWYMATTPSKRPVRGVPEDRVGREGPLDEPAGLAGHGDGRLDDPLLLVAEQAVLAGVGVEAADGDPRVLDAEPLAQGVGHQVDRLEHAADGERVAQVEQRLVDAGQGHPQLAADEHHRDPVGLEGVAELLGVAGEAVAGHVPAFLADRGGDDGLDHVLAGRVDGRVEETHGGVAALGGGAVDRAD